jgi:hypothetical protein
MRDGVGSMDADQAGLEWLSEHIEDRGRELRRFVQEEYSVRGSRRRARPNVAAATTNHRRGGRGVVRRLEGWPAHECRSNRATGEGPQGCCLQGRRTIEVGQDPG